MRAEVLYTTLGMPLFGLDDVELQQICFSVFNDWLGEYASYAPKRLYPIALISLEDIAAGVKELERCAKMGFKGAMIWGAPPEDKPYSKAIYDPFWAAAQETSIPISLHVITQKKQNEIKFDGPRGGRPILDPIFEVQQSIRSLIYGGALERFPGLKIVSAENDAGWIGHFMHRLDHIHVKWLSVQPRRQDQDAAQRISAPATLGDLPGRSAGADYRQVSSAKTISCGRPTSPIPIPPGRIPRK